MIVNKYGNGGGGSASGVTPEQVEQEIQSALTPYWESGETKDYVDEAVSGIDLSNYYTSGETDAAIAEAVSGLATEQYVQDALSGVDLTNYWTSAETEDAISAATSGKADASNLSQQFINVNSLRFPLWNKQGIITGYKGAPDWYQTYFYKNGASKGSILTTNAVGLGEIYAPENPGNAGDILVSTGNGAPVWSSVTMSDTEEIELPIAAAVNKLKGDFEARLDQQYYKKQETNSLLKEKVTAGQVDIQIKNYTDPLFQAVYETIEDKELPVSAAINELNEAINLIDEVVPAALVDLNERKVGSDSVHTIWRGTQTEYDAITTKDASTLYIIVNE